MNMMNRPGFLLFYVWAIGFLYVSDALAVDANTLPNTVAKTTSFGIWAAIVIAILIGIVLCISGILKAKDQDDFREKRKAVWLIGAGVALVSLGIVVGAVKQFIFTGESTMDVMGNLGESGRSFTGTITPPAF